MTSGRWGCYILVEFTTDYSQGQAVGGGGGGGYEDSWWSQEWEGWSARVSWAEENKNINKLNKKFPEAQWLVISALRMS